MKWIQIKYDPDARNLGSGSSYRAVTLSSPGNRRYTFRIHTISIGDEI
jgi:hypothetical protein